MLLIRKAQYDALDKMHSGKFYGDLEKYLTEEFSDIGDTERNRLMVSCHDACESLKIRNMDGIFAFYVLSFIHGSPVDRTIEYRVAHKRYILLGYSPEQLPVDVLEAMY